MLTGVDIKAQEAPAGFRAEFLEQFTYSTDRLLSLSEAIPAEKYAWRPGDGVMSIEEVYMHIARYNYYYPKPVSVSKLHGALNYRPWNRSREKRR